MAELTDEFTLVVGDEKASSANSVALYRNASGELVFKDGTAGEKTLDSLSTITSHPGLSGLDGDDHDTGANAYHTDTRHLTVHDNTFNNDLAISGAIEADATLGAHASNADIHYLRPVQTLTVAESGTGQYATVAAALAVANANADATTPYEVALYPGVYAESNLTLAAYVSMRSVVPRQARISAIDNANPMMTCSGHNYISGIFINTIGNGGAVTLAAANVTEDVTLDNCNLFNLGSGRTIEFNGTNSAAVLRNSEVDSVQSNIIGGKTASSRIQCFNVEFGWNAPTPTVPAIDIDDSVGGSISSADFFYNCIFSATGIVGGSTPLSFVDFADSGNVYFQNCVWSMSNPAGKTTNALLMQAGTAVVQGCQFNWVTTSGTPYDFNAAGGAEIKHAATVYDVAKTTGAGTISALSEGAALFDNIVSTGSLSMSAPDNPLINLSPSGTGDTDVFSITPSAALAGANTWRGFSVDGAALDPAAAGATVFGGVIDLSDVDQTNNPNLCGLLINMPPAATTTGDFHAIKLTGGGNTLILLNKDFLIDLTATSGVPLQAVFSDSSATSVVQAASFKHLTSASATTAGVFISLDLEDDTASSETLAKIEAIRDGADNIGTLQFKAGVDGNAIGFRLDGSDGSSNFPLALSAAAGVYFGGASANIYEDGLGLVINDAGQVPIIIGETVIIKLGDALGVERLSVKDSGDQEKAFCTSDGFWFSGGYGHVTDTNTRLIFPVADAIALQAGNVEFLRCTEAVQDECVVNEGGLDIDFRVESLTKSRAIVCDGATADVTMAGTLTVGDSGEVNMLGVTDGTNTAMLGYNGVPHIAITGDTSWIVSAEDTDSDMNLIVRANGTGTARSRAQTSGGDWIGINHDGVRGSIDSSLGGIRLSDDTEFNGDISYTSSGGQSIGGISVFNNAAATAITTATTPVQFLGFDTNDPTHGDVTPDHTNDHVTVGVAGKYFCSISLTIDTVGVTAQKLGAQAYKNNGTTAFPNVHAHSNLAGGGSEEKSMSLSGLIDLALNDTIELWIVNETTTGNILVSDCTMSLMLLAGT